MSTELKVRHFIDDTYQVVEFYLNGDGDREYEETCHQGSLADCEAYIRLKESDLLV